MISLIATTNYGQLQIETCSGLLKVCEVVSKMRMTIDEKQMVGLIELLLQNLKQPAAIVREYSLKVCFFIVVLNIFVKSVIFNTWNL